MSDPKIGAHDLYDNPGRCRCCNARLDQTNTGKPDPIDREEDEKLHSHPCP